MRIKRFVLSVFLTCAAFFVALPAFSQSDWYYGKPIKDVTFEGLKNIKKSDLEGVTSSFIGKEFSDEVFSDLLNRIFALNYFEDINPQAVGDSSAKTVTIKLQVVELPIVSKIKFDGNSRVRSSELKDAISTKDKDIYNEDKRLADERALRELYIGKGFTEVKISSSAEQNEKGFEVVFKIDEGKQTVVKSITFTGNNVVSSRTLKGKISLKEVGLLNRGSYQEAMVEQDKKAILTYYKDRGYVDAKILNVTVTPTFNEKKGRQELAIQFNIQEGSEYKFEDIAFEGNTVFSTEELQKLIKLKKGGTYNETLFQEGFMAVQSKYYENGYMQNRFVPQMNKDSEQRKISIVISITENTRSHVEEVLIKGNTKTKEEVIRREIPIESGDIFSYAKVTNALRSLYNTQYFSSVVPDVTPGSENNLVDLVFTVEEQSTTSLDFGLTFSGVSDPDEFPVSLYTKIQDTNLFGEGKTVSAGINLSTTEQSLSFSYGQNWLFNKPISNTISLSFAHATKYDTRNAYLPDGTLDTDYYYMQYEQNSISLSDTIGRRWSPDFAILTWSGGISGSLINNKYDSKLYMPVDTSVSDYENNLQPRNYVFTAFSLDGRNINFDPSRGWFASQRLSWYGLIPQGIFSEDWGETEFFLRTDTKLEKYFTIFDIPISEGYSFKSILMFYTGLSFQFPIPDTSIKQSNQLYIDGMFYGRGWSIYNTAAGRGKALLNNTIELRFPVIPNIISLDGFFDASVIKDEPEDLFNDFSNLDDWYFSVGPSIRCCLQQFPLRLLFVSNFKFVDGEFSWRTRHDNEASGFWDSFHFVLSFNITNR